MNLAVNPEKKKEILTVMQERLAEFNLNIAMALAVTHTNTTLNRRVYIHTVPKIEI